VTRNLISVDHRYAQMGKWQEAQLTSRGADPLVVGHVDDLKEDQMKLLHVNGKRVVLARTSDGYRAFDDYCTHRGGSLAGGVVIGGTVQCLWHGSQFDVSTGAVSCGPAKKRIAVYGIEERPNGQIVLVSPPE
jgi:nitrite reductase/ring-hydroxylating ferredoxin subunit